ncbi:hypothetical protein [Luteipulveratus flavus]|uniref:DUF4352 domain-containing protein n=1 Tax=Luteipulveratus flavus TaxID=3031728 RepID=A0ABT6CAZ0_9MICO|nr:hypothetical protein [Luteipulveratus sp. YIM 133296]MDF8265224.1 hypothetical protein [Luteipulveratus sp. YIM 133296]
MIATRRLRLAVIPAAFAALALAGCQDEAPTAAPPAAPTSQAPAATSSAPAPTAAPSSEAPSSQAPAPAPTSSTPSPNSSGPASGVECNSTLSSNRRGDSPAKPIGTKQAASGIGFSKDDSVEVIVGKPTIDSTSTDDYFPGDGMVVLKFPTLIKATAGSAVVSYLNFSLLDPEGNPCDPDVSGTVVAKTQQLDVTTVKAGDSLSGLLVFAAPAGADYTKYNVVFASESRGKAELAWTAS